MRDWLSYRLSDLLLFSPRTYYRMFELYHDAVWPAQLIALVLVVMIAVLLWRTDDRAGVAIAAVIAASWLWVAVAFQLRQYAGINWAARYFAALFVVQATLLAWLGIVRRRLTFTRRASGGRWVSPAVFVVSTVLSPLAGRAAGRAWTQVEWPGLTPDATVVATLALLLLATPRAPRVLMLAPLAWCVIGGATLWALESSEALVLVVAGVAGVASMIWRRTRRF
jgi:hypothetical protein